MLCMILIFMGCASSSVKEVYGTWYNDTDGIRNIIQLYEYDSSTKNAFIWAIYDIKADKRTSVDSGTYTLGDGTITLTYSSGASVTLEYTKNEDTLTLIMDGAMVEFRLYVLADNDTTT
ncbi:hypothetical protein IMSAG013_01490 [Clostridiales bacterium]|nr:hypothetical protein [Clostridiales bacterium]GFI56429.1 hypothetical protein IMSAG013_01490 [Clostridiales bacterium]